MDWVTGAMGAEALWLADGAKVRFGRDFGKVGLRLLELPEDVLAHLLGSGGGGEGGSALHIKGGTSAGEEAVLCTGEETFELKWLETSNTMLMCPAPDASVGGAAEEGVAAAAAEAAEGGGDGPSVPKRARVTTLRPVAAAYGHYEVTRVAPRLHRVRELLQRRPYRGRVEGDGPEDGDVIFTTYDSPRWVEEGEAGDEEAGTAGDAGPSSSHAAEGPGGFRFAELLSTVQASAKELRRELHRLRAVRVNGRWMLVDPPYVEGLLEVLLYLCAEEDWRVSRIDADAACAAFDGEYPAWAVRLCLSEYGTQDSPGVFRLDEGRIFRSLAEKVFSPMLVGGGDVDAPLPLALFEETWRVLVEQYGVVWETPLGGDGDGNGDGDGPGGGLSRSLLEGIALIEPNIAFPGGLQIRRFHQRDLPLQPRARFERLFDAKKRWTRAQIEPYLVDLVGPCTTVDSMLLKHARRVTAEAGSEDTYALRT